MQKLHVFAHVAVPVKEMVLNESSNKYNKWEKHTLYTGSYCSVESVMTMTLILESQDGNHLIY